MPKTLNVEVLEASLQRSKEIFVSRGQPGGLDSAARAYGYLEMAVERFLQSQRAKAKRRGARKS